MRRLILGTAGHIDHGKTALVRALTGTDTDRLPEEKRRGITIDLGFARLPLDDELELGVVDVPGHEAFVRNMLAGATGFDLALLVVAADEGVMPQTREHLAIIELLGVRAGVVALTKTDLVDDEWLTLVLEDVRAGLHGSAFADAPIVPVSAVTGAGLEELRRALADAARHARARADDDLFRLPIDRVFTIHGTGTVVTGTLWSGHVRTEDALALLPDGPRARVRGVQVHGQPEAVARAGQRAAIALAGVERDQVIRGQVLVREEGWSPTTLLTVRLRVIPGTGWKLAQRQRIRFHLGTAELLGRIRLFGADALDPDLPGATLEAYAQIGLEGPVIARAGDRFVIRSYSPVTTIGGGIVLEPAASRRRRLGEHEAELLDRLLAPPADAVLARAVLAGWSGVAATGLAVETPHPPAEIAVALDAHLATGALGRVGDRVFDGAVLEQARRVLLEVVERFHEVSPLRPGIDRQELRRALPPGAAPGLADALVDTLVGQGIVVARGERGELLARAGFQPHLTHEQAVARDRLLALYESAELAAPSVDELPAELRQRRDFWPLLKLLESEGHLLAMAPETFVSAAAMARARERARRELAGKGALGPADFRALFPLTRKHLIPLLEYFDRSGLTVRRGNDRFLAPT